MRRPGPASNLLVLRGGAAPLQIVTGRGVVVPEGAAAIAEASSSGSDLSIIASVGGQSRGRKLLNALFDSEFSTTLSLGPVEESAAGAWVSAAPNAPNIVLLDTEPSDVLAEGARRSPAEASKLASLSFSIADAILVHSPGTAPSEAALKVPLPSSVRCRMMLMLLPNAVDLSHGLTNKPPGLPSLCTILTAHHFAWWHASDLV